MNVTEQTTAKCSRCHNVKPITDFHSKRTTRIMKTCARCRHYGSDGIEIERKRRARYKVLGIKPDKRTTEERREYNKQYRARTIEKRREYQREYQRKYRARKRLEKQKILTLIAT